MYLVGVPEADGAAERQLPHKQIVHPAKGELQVFDLVLPKVIMYLLWNSTFHLHTWGPRCSSSHARHCPQHTGFHALSS